MVRRPIVARTKVPPGDSFGSLFRQYIPATGGADRGWDGGGQMPFSVVEFDDESTGRSCVRVGPYLYDNSGQPTDSAGLFRSCTREASEMGPGTTGGGT